MGSSRKDPDSRNDNPDIADRVPAGKPAEGDPVDADPLTKDAHDRQDGDPRGGDPGKAELPAVHSNYTVIGVGDDAGSEPAETTSCACMRNDTDPAARTGSAIGRLLKVRLAVAAAIMIIAAPLVLISALAEEYARATWYTLLLFYSEHEYRNIIGELLAEDDTADPR